MRANRLRFGATCDGEYALARRRLSLPDGGGLSRRRFLQAGLAGTGLAVLSQGIGGPFGRAFSSLAAAAAPVASGEGILVVILLGGGNDGFSMVVPASDPAYYAARADVAVAADKVLPIDGGFGFHPSLPKLASRYAAGKVACVMGVDYPDPDLSHFTSMQNWMTAQPGVDSDRPTGWLGRWLDAVGNPDGLTAVAIDDTVPLHMVGSQTQATALPVDLSSQFAPKSTDIPDTRLIEALSSFAAAPTGLGSWGDALAANNALSLGLSAELVPMYSPALPTADLSEQLALVARLINANFGIRAFAVEWGGDFDVHSNETGRYPALMTSLDNGIDAFYQALDASWSSSVALMTFSEFGRRVKANNSGTDHGTASTMLVIGDSVKGGLAGQPPSLTNLDDNGNVLVTTDFRSVYATMISDWLQGDPDQVLGGSYPTLPLFNSPPSNPVNPAGSAAGGDSSSPASGGSGAPAGSAGGLVSAPAGYWLIGSTGTVYPFGGAVPFSPGSSTAPVVGMATTPSGQGGWVLRSDGSVQPVGTAPYVGTLAGRTLAAPLVGIASTPTGEGCWVAAADGGVFTLGDARFAGSAGSRRLVRPIVGIAPTPTGQGYRLAASDGGVFTFGDAGFFGSLPSSRGSAGAGRLARPIVGMVSTAGGAGYWLVASDGGIFTFGDAGFFGSVPSSSASAGLGAERLARPIVGMAPTPNGHGYWLVASDGGVFTFGDATFEGGLGGSPPKNPVVGVTA